MNEPLRVLVADDEPLAREAVARALHRVDDVEIVAETCDGPETMRALERGGIDVAFLDIRMPGLDGFEVLDGLAAPFPAVVFVTAWDEYALRAFDAHAVDYVLKPVDEERLRAALEQARTHVRGQRAGEIGARLSGLLRTLRDHPPACSRIAIRMGARDVLVELSDIDWIEGDRNYVRIVTGGRRYSARETLSAMETRLADHDFLRIHRSTLVNMARVREIRRDRAGRSFAILADGSRLRVSESGEARLYERLERY